MVPTDNRDHALRQFGTVSKLLHVHLDGLSLEEMMWRPASKGLHIYQEGNGGWTADWPDREDYDLGPPSGAWVAWHIVYWWSMVLNHSFGDGKLSRETIDWTGENLIEQILESEKRWLECLSQIDDDDLASSAFSTWPMPGRPFGDVVGWVNIELTKNAAELGLLRFLYAVRNC